MGDLSIISGIISFIALIVFFVMASGIGSMKRDMAKIRKFVDAYSKETGIGMSFKCAACNKTFVGKQETCPHCQAKTGL